GNQRSQRISQRDDIFVLVIGRAVYQLDVGKIWQGHWTVWQFPQPVKVLGSECVARPDRGRGGHGIEIVQIHQSRGGFVVIPTHEDLAQFAGATRHFMRTGAIAYDVTQVHDDVE